MATDTMVIEMQPQNQLPIALHSSEHADHALQEKSDDSPTEPQGPTNASSSARHVVTKRERWNDPRINTWRLSAVFYAFIVFGMNDASYGALIPYVCQRETQSYQSYSRVLTIPCPQIGADYHLSYLVTSLVFLSPFAGYTLAAFFSDRLHRLAGRRGVAIFGPSCKLIAYIVISCHPPYPVVVVILASAGIGNGLLDAAWNAWLGTMDHPNQLLGLLHGCYGLGATISPIIGTSMITKGNLPWWNFYYIMAGLVTLELIAGTISFWSATGRQYRNTNRTDGEHKGMTRRALKNKVTWICSAFFLAYVGLEGTSHPSYYLSYSPPLPCSLS